MKAHTYYINLGRPPIGGKLPLIPPLAAPLMDNIVGLYTARQRRLRMLPDAVNYVLLAEDS